MVLRHMLDVMSFAVNPEWHMAELPVSLRDNQAGAVMAAAVAYQATESIQNNYTINSQHNG